MQETLPAVVWLLWCEHRTCRAGLPQKRDAIAKQLLARASAAKPGKGKTVYRNLRDGDVMLTNRQPTLHKPGMMAHRARVLKVGLPASC